MTEVVLVTGCGGDIAIAIARILRETGVATRIVGTDIHEDHPGDHVYDGTEVLPRATAPGYLDALRKVVDRLAIDIIIPTSEAEISALYDAGATTTFGSIPVLLANRRAIEIGLDKLATTRFLEAQGLPHPWTVPVAQGNPLMLPCIIKGRRGRGSKNVHVVDAANIDGLRASNPNAIWQELLLPEDEEYTCGLFRAKSGGVRAIILNRRLQGGLTGFGTVVGDEAIEVLLEGIARGLDLRGSINVQLRLTDRGPVVFEINARFSSTVMFRHKMGFTDLVWAIRDQQGDPLGDYIPPPVGTRIIRGAHEYIVPPRP